MNWEILVSSGELRKVLGLRRYAEKEISLDVKIDYDKKKKAACTGDNGDLRCIPDHLQDNLEGSLKSR
jgi:hypothetical protein